MFEEPDTDDTPDVFIKRDVGGVYEIVTETVESCDEVTPEGKFPEKGDRFLEVKPVRADGTPRDENAYIAFYVDVQRALAQMEAEVGDRVRIRILGKDESGSWEAMAEEA